MFHVLLLLALQPAPAPPLPPETAPTTTAETPATAPTTMAPPETPAPTTTTTTTPPPAPPPAPAAATRECTLAVLDLEAGDAISPPRARALSDIVTAEVGAHSTCAVLSRSDIRGVLSFEAEKQLMGCASDSCMAELAGALGADYLVTGTITRIEGSMLVSMRMTDMKTLKVARRATDSFAGDDADAIPFVGWLSRKLMTDDPAKIGPRPVPAPKGGASQSTVWRPLFWTSFGLTLAGAVATAAAGGATVLMSDAAKKDVDTASQLQDAGPVVADVANVSLYATGALLLSTIVLFFTPAEEEVTP
jgi:TolB-like protein